VITSQQVDDYTFGTHDSGVYDEHDFYRAIGTPTVTKQYIFGTGVSWEGDRRSGVALAMRHRQCGITIYGLTALGREMSTPPTLQ